MSMFLVAAGVSTFVLSVAFTIGVRAAAHRIGMVAAPTRDRWHKKPTALLGGAAIFAAFVVGFLAFGDRGPALYPIVAGGAFLFLVGLIDDAVQLKPYTKLVAQLIASAVVVYFGHTLPWTSNQAVNDLITIFWLIGITNAINLLDNMDGLAGGIGVISCVFLVTSLLLNGQPGAVMLPILLAGAVLGFLLFNFNPATIFMGDCGSLFLGFMLGSAALLCDYGRTRNLAAVLCTPVLILLIPIFDTTFVTVTRKLSGRRVSQGGRDHSSHRLVALGMSERRAVFMLYIFAAVSGSLALMVKALKAEVILLLIPGFALIALFTGLYLGKVRIFEDEKAPVEGVTMNALAGFGYKRRVFELLLDIVLMALAWYAALLLRFDGNLPEEQVMIFARALPLMLGAQMAFFWLGGVYRGLWRYAGVTDLVIIGKSVAVGGVAGAALVLVTSIHATQTPSRAVLILNPVLLFMLVGGSRLSFRLLRALILDGKSRFPANAKPVLIYGAGDGGELLFREILNNPGHCYAPVAFIDDDVRKTGKVIHGCRIFHSGQVEQLVRKHGVNEVVISTLKVSDNKLDALRGLGLHIRKLRIQID